MKMLKEEWYIIKVAGFLYCHILCAHAIPIYSVYWLYVNNYMFSSNGIVYIFT